MFLGDCGFDCFWSELSWSPLNVLESSFDSLIDFLLDKCILALPKLEFDSKVVVEWIESALLI